ncbi:hypothetical protein N8T08_004030 [Aspergillus melleus]|uniref:Uncharacterized protein n=1 Tax=Aspergillus melleus TaxID=138277 RepID=A0ACC3B6Z7_9EURO|nr:hypothetical protein N8T08_004030 [Aspergillus melleus]
MLASRVGNVTLARSNAQAASLAPTVARQRLRRNVNTLAGFGVSRYIDGLLNEIHRLRGVIQATSVASPNKTDSRRDTDSDSRLRYEINTADSPHETPSRLPRANMPHTTVTPPPSATEPHEGVRNPLLDDRPWFFTLTPEMPILVGEASDAGFATRLRQELLGRSQGHYPRTQNIRDEALCSLWTSEDVWPTPSRARFLLKVAFRTACRRYYITRKSTTLQLLEQAILDPTSCDLLSTCKLYALFALGEAYSTRSSQFDKTFPGIAYYASATRMLRVFSEQPRIDCVEIMMSIYALAMNRRHSAYCMVGSAVRFGVIMGLHLNVPQDQLPNRELREHRNRVWWTAYILDRSWSYMLGKPVSIPDEDIDVDLPSDVQPSSQSTAEDFADTAYLTAGVHVARIGAQIAASIYGRRPQVNTFSQRVRQALQDLDGWLQGLPATLRAAISQVPPNAPMPLVTLYLYFNQQLGLYCSMHFACVVRGTRAARTIDYHSMKPPLLYQKLVSNAHEDHTMSSPSPGFLQDPSSSADRDDFETTVQILKQLDHNGNYAAKEFCRHVDSIKAILESGRYLTCQPGCPQCPPAGPTADDAILPASCAADAVAESADVPRLGLDESSLEGLLSQSNLDLGFLDPSVVDDGFQAFMWLEGDFN